VRLELRIDATSTQISTRDPDLLARWLLEQFALIRWTPATYVTAQAWPSWSDWDESGKANADWITLGPHLGQAWEIKTPEELLDQLGDALKRARGDQRS